MGFKNLEYWLTNTYFGKYLSGLERQFLQHKLANLRFGTILQNGFTAWQFTKIFAAPSQYIIQNSYFNDQTMLVADSLAMPWAEQSIDTLIWPHGLDEIATDEQAMAEAAKILVPGGSLLLTGLNNKGYWHFFYRRDVNLQFWQPRSVSTLVANLQKHNLFMTEGHFLGYGFPGCFGSDHQTIEYMGNRWWPHLAAIYALVLVKRNTPLNLIPKQTNKTNLVSSITDVKIVPV